MMDSDAEKTEQHQQLRDRENAKNAPRYQADIIGIDSLLSVFEVDPDHNNNDNISLPQTSPMKKDDEIEDPKTEDIVEPGLPTLPTTLSQRHSVLKNITDTEAIDSKIISVNSRELTSTTSSISTTVVEPAKQMTSRQKATVLVLCFINLLKYMDRFTIAGILTDIQCDFGITDAQGGLLSTAFVVSYMIFSPVFGYLGDRFSRKLIMAIGIAFWSLSTLGGSFTQTYGVFLATRIMVGIGEAMYSTVSPTIISDVCIGDTRSNYLMLYFFAIPVGSGLGFVVGAVMASAFGSWQWALRITPILGATSVLLVIFVVREPPRGEAEGSTLSATTYWDDLKYLAKNKSYVLSTAGITCVTYVSGALAWWGPKFMTLGLATTQGVAVSYSRTSVIVGFEAALSGVLGVASGSLVGQKLRKRFPTADPLVCAWSMVICAPLLYWGTAIADGPAIPTYTVFFFGQWFMNVSWALVGDILLYVVIPTRRSTAEAFSILISHALGDAGSPYIVGLVSDSFKKSLMADATSPKVITSHDFYDGPMLLEESGDDCSGSSFINPDTVVIDFTALQYSFFITTVVGGLSALFFFANAWYIVKDKANVDKAVTENETTKRLEKLEEQASIVKA